MPYKDHEKQLSYLQAWRVKHAAEVRRKKHQYYLEHREEFAERRRKSRPTEGSIEGPYERSKLKSSRDLARWRDVPGAARLPVRRGRRRLYLGTRLERHAQAQRIHRAKEKKARETAGHPEDASH
jgi:hypothetical protein